MRGVPTWDPPLASPATKVRGLYEANAKQRQKAAGGDKRSRKAKGKTVKENLPEPIGGQSRDAAGEAVGAILCDRFSAELTF